MLSLYELQHTIRKSVTNLGHCSSPFLCCLHSVHSPRLGDLNRDRITWWKEHDSLTYHYILRELQCRSFYGRRIKKAHAIRHVRRRIYAHLTFSSSPSFMLRAPKRSPAYRETELTRAVADWPLSHLDPIPHGVAAGAPTKAAFDDEACPAHGLAVATPAVASKAHVLIIVPRDT